MLLSLCIWAPSVSAWGRSGEQEHALREIGTVTGSPGLPPGFAKVFTDRFVDVGSVRLHAVIGGEGPPLLLVHGWPQTWYAWRLIMPALAQHYSVVAVDQRGIGLSDKPQDGYDSATLATDLVGLMRALGHERFSIYGTDVGMPIAYAVAADHPASVDHLAVSEAFLPGIAGGVSSLPLLQPYGVVNARVWHLLFNQLPPEVNEALVRGREDVFFGAEFDSSAGTHKLPDEAVQYYVRMLRSDPNALRGSFGFYRALWTTAAADVKRSAQKLTIPVLAMGGAESADASVGQIMQMVATDVHTVVIPGAAHWIAEQAPDAVVAALTDFLSN
jgi:pimeloyl-ACP methyl ester carboxylesterase